MSSAEFLNPMEWSRKRRIRGRRGVSRNLLLATIAGLLLSSFAVFGVFLYVSQEPDPTEQLEIALRLLTKGDVESAASVAGRIPTETLKKKSDHSKRHFLLGVNARTKAKKIEQHRLASQLNEEAVEHLKRSRDREFPPGGLGMGNYHLGMALYELFRWEEAVEPLEIAADRYPQGRADAIERLVDVDLSRARNDFQTALERIDLWRSLPDSGLYDDQRTDLKHMQALLAMGKCDQALKLETRIPVDSPYRPLCDLLCGRCWRRIAEKTDNAESRRENLEKAMDLFQSCLKSTVADINLRHEVNLEIGQVQRDLGKLIDAVSTLSLLRLSAPYDPASVAAGIEELETLFQAGRKEDLIHTLEQLSNTLSDPKYLDSDQLPLSVVRERVIQVGNGLIDEKDYAIAARFARKLPSICDELDRLRLEARLYSDWAESLESQPNEKNQQIEYFKKSAKAYRSLTEKLPIDEEYGDWLWKAIENFRKGQSFQESNQLLTRFIAEENPNNRPRGFLVQAKNYSSLDKNDEAQESLRQLLARNPLSPLAYDGRLDLARIKIDAEEFDEAEQLLLENLSGDLNPSSPIWRESLYELGAMLFARGEKLQLKTRNEIDANPSQTFELIAQVESSHDILKRSIVRIEDFLRRYTDDPRRFYLLYQMAKAYQLASFWPEFQLNENTSSTEDTINSLKAQRKGLLTNSRQAYRRLRLELLQENVRDPRSTNLRELLRNSYFGEADLFFYDGEFEEGMGAYLEASNWFINEPESLEARKQIAICQKQLGKYGDCRRSLEYAKSMLQRIPADRDSRFKTATALDRAGWENYLTLQLAELDSLEGKNKP
jgi:tetratricopeptide (TPR) repeat protein